MNRIDFSKAGGFPLETETLEDMQKSYQLLEAFGDIVGSKSIIKGCALIGNTVTDGVIYWDGEVLEFKGGLAESKIVIIETKESVPFEDGDIEEVYIKRHATFGTGIGEALWADFKRAYPLTSALVIDEVKMYVGAIEDIPWGWYLADGQNGTMDMRDRFPVPFNPDNEDYDTIGKIGGLKEVGLTVNQLPKHRPTGSTNSAGGHTPTGTAAGPYTGSAISGGGGFDGGNNGFKNRPVDMNPVSSHSHSITMNEIGNDEKHENRPPFKVVVFIQFKGV